MKVIVGLGNPGRRYEGTRHNVGFELVRELARRWNDGSRAKAKFDAEILEIKLDGRPACLVSPLTYMNESGRCVRQVVDFYKLDNSELLVVCDDFNLPLGRIRLRPDGSHGGQNGLEDILTKLGTQAVPRLRIGIGPLPPNWNPADFVLSRFDAAERLQIEPAINRAADAVVIWAAEGMGPAMNRFNREPAELSGDGPNSI